MTTTSRAAPRRTARTPLSRRRVLAAALSHLDEHGLEGLTMHNLAAELGVGDMSLYNHVRNKDDLLDGIGELIWAEIAAALPRSATDAAWLLALGRAILDAGRRHPHAVPTVLLRGDVFPPSMLEVFAAQFDRDGTREPDPKLVNGIGAVAAFAFGWLLFTSSGAGAGQPETERQRILRVTRALPPDTPDRLVDVAIAVCARDVDALFASGLDAVISGCGLDEARAPSQRRRSR